MEHPEAQDSLEGIVEWWLLDQQIRRSVAEVEAALTQFVSEGLIVTRQGLDGRIRYRLNPEKEIEIRARLKRTGRNAAGRQDESPRNRTGL